MELVDKVFSLNFIQRMFDIDGICVKFMGLSGLFL